MADRDTAPDDDRALKKRLLTRVAVAGVVIVTLLGGLALIDTMQAERSAKAPVRPGQSPAATTTAPQSDAAGEKTARQPVATQSDAGMIRPGEQAAPEEEKAAKPPAEGTLALPSPPGSDRGPTRPAEARIASLRPAEPLPPARRAEREVAALAAPTSPRVPATPAAAPAAPPMPAQPAVARHAPPSRPLSRLAETSSQFVLQLGVFSNLANAEELRARLELAGVPAHLEARVQVGPFATREEAAQAQEKIRALGLEPGLVVAVKR